MKPLRKSYIQLLGYLALLLAIPTKSFGQGQLDFSNLNWNVDSPVFEADGKTRLDSAFFGQLYVGVSANNLAAAGDPVRFQDIPGTGGSGYIFAPLPVDVPFVPGVSVFLEVRVWEANGGPSYETAVAAGARVGKSIGFQVKTGGGILPPSTLAGLQSFSVSAANPNHPPTASGFAATTPVNQPLLLSYQSLLSVISDPDNQPFHIASVGTTQILIDAQVLGTVELSTNGAFVVADGSRVVYIPRQDFVGADRFSYVVADWLNATATVDAQIAVLAPGVTANTVQAPSLDSGAVTFNFAGLPGKTYDVQRALSIDGPWQAIGSILIQPDGTSSFTDAAPLPGNGFYRTVLRQ